MYLFKRGLKVLKHMSISFIRETCISYVATQSYDIVHMIYNKYHVCSLNAIQDMLYSKNRMIIKQTYNIVFM